MPVRNVKSKTLLTMKNETKKNIQIEDLDDLDELETMEDIDELDDLDDLDILNIPSASAKKPAAKVVEEEEKEHTIDTELLSERFFIKSAAYGFSAHEVNSKVCDDSIMDVVVHEGPGHDDIERIYQLYIYDYTTQAVIVNYMEDDSIEIQLPMLASEADVELCYAYLNALKDLQPNCAITLANGKVADISEEAAVKKYIEHCSYLAKQMRQGDIELSGINAPFNPSKSTAIAEASNEDRIEVAWAEFQKAQWEEEE